MIQLHKIPEEDIRAAIDQGELPEHIRSAAKNVAVIATQDWCPDWKTMHRWLTAEAELPGTDVADTVAPANTATDTPNVDVFVIVYNKAPYQQEFMQLKEGTWNNAQIPYVRYYRYGRYLGDSNHLPREAFFQRFSDSE